MKLFKLLIVSILELFEKLFDFLSSRREEKAQYKTKSYALPEPCYSAANRDIQTVSDQHAGLSGFYLLENNLDAFVARSNLINNADKTLDLQYYYFHGDTSGHLIAQLLIKAAERGVRIRILLDDIDTLGADEPIRLLNAVPNIEMRIFNPFYFRGLLRYLEFITDLSRVGRRMHNKAIIADNCQAIVGGRNIGDIYFSADPEQLFLDIDLLSVGPVVHDISASFDEYWNSRWAVPVNALYSRPDKIYAKKRIKQFLQRYVQDVRQIDYVNSLQLSHLTQYKTVCELPLVWSRARLFYDDPSKIENNSSEIEKNIKENLFQILSSVEKELTIISPYFVPGKEGVEWIRQIRQRGVKVNIFTNSLAATDVVAVHAGYAPYRQELLASGVNLYELKPSSFARERKKYKLLRAGSRTSLHAKTVIIDHQQVFIGSPNLDPRSSDLNTEIGLLVDNKTLADQVIELFAGISSRHNSYHLMRDPAGKLIWVSEEEGGHVRYRDEPHVGVWRKLQLSFFRLLPIEDLL